MLVPSFWQSMVLGIFLLSLTMSQPNRNWSVLSWKVRGMNDSRKWNAIHNKIEESSCVAFCLQETKCAAFDIGYLKNFCPK
jgi:hypothetical protein